ncbi:MAG: LCP family protein [Anaerolineales bacterium]|nr:LCP family protein [Anaerolineales bacterium]
MTTEKKFDFSKTIENIPLSRAVAWGVALVAAIGIFVFLRGFVAGFDLLELPGMAVTHSPGGEIDLGTGSAPTPEVVAPASDLPEAWDGASRVTILFLGLDQRDTDAEVDAPRSDTMILFTMDPVSKTAGMLSIPRDMWVNIPGGFDYGKINTAYALGEAYKLPGGGPALAVQTVEKFLGVPIQYYAQVDFHAFEESIDDEFKINLSFENSPFPEIDEDIKNVGNKLAQEVFKLTECISFARVDMFLCGREFLVNEINTLPGFTEISLFPQLLINEGWSFECLLTRILELAEA